MMLPSPLRTSVFGVFLTGCAHAPQTPPPSPAPETTIVPAFGKDAVANESYQKLLSANVALKDIDRGCHVIDYRQPGPNESVQFAGDKKIQECEVVEYVLDRYEQYPDLARMIIGGPIPWSLDAPDSDAKFAAEQRAVIGKEIRVVTEILVKQGIDPKSERFKEDLAVALFYFALFPEKLSELPPDIAYMLQEESKKLSYGGLDAYRNRLLQSGGLGLAAFKGSRTEEHTALEALQLREGTCTERSKILYAIYKLAGLQPHFVFGRMQDLDPKLSRHMKLLPPSSREDDHIYVGMRFGDRTRFFDPSLVLLTVDDRMDDHDYYSMRLIHYLAMDKNNISIDLQRVVRRTDREKILSQALYFDPGFPTARMNKAYIMMQAGEAKSAMELDRLIADYPGDARVYEMRGGYYRHRQDYEKAVEDLLKAVALDPLLPDANYNLGATYYDLRRFAEAESYLLVALQLGVSDPMRALRALALTYLESFELQRAKKPLHGKAEKVLYEKAKGILLETYRIAPNDGETLISLARLNLYAGQINEAAAYIEKVPADFRTETYYQYIRGLIYLEQGKAGAAERVLRQAIKVNPKHVRSHVALAAALLEQGKDKEAERQIALILRTGNAEGGLAGFRRIMPNHPQLPAIVRIFWKLDSQKPGN